MDSDSDPQDVDLLGFLFSDEDFSDPSILFDSVSSGDSSHYEITCETCKATMENEIPACAAATMVGSTDHIVFEITKYLRKSDLINCTLVNTTWEREARKHLLNRTQIILEEPEELLIYQGVMNVHNRCHESFQFGEIEDLLTEKATLNFIDKFGGKVKKLSVRWPTSVDSANNFKTFCKFKNVKEMEIRGDNYCWSHFEKYVPPYCEFPSVERLTVDMGVLNTDYRKVICTNKILDSGLARIMLSLFPNINSLHVPGFQNAFFRQIAKDPTPYFEISELIINPKGYIFDNRNRFSYLTWPTTLSSLDISISISDWVYETPNVIEVILYKFAPTLEKFHLRGIKLNWKGFQRSVKFPKMPKLKLLEVLHANFFENNKRPPPDLEADEYSVLLETLFQFETENSNNTINYETQFPALTTLILKGENGPCGPFTIFSASMALYDMFFPKESPSFSSVKKLDINYPLTKIWKDEIKIKSSEVTHCSIFYNRVAATFPNVDNVSLGPYRKDEAALSKINV